MPILEARIETERAGRYLTQFCKHAAAMGSGGHTPRIHLHGMMARRDVQVAAEWSDTEGRVTFTPWGTCTLTADTSALALRIEGADEDGLRQIKDVVTRDVERFSRRDPLAVSWHEPESSGAAASHHSGGLIHRHRGVAVRSRRQTVLLSLAVLMVLGVHIGLAGTVVADSGWTGMATIIVVVVVALKLALIALARFGIRSRKAAKAHVDSVSSESS